MWRPWVTTVVVSIAALLCLSITADSRAKVPGWQPGEHPRLLFTAGEKASILAKLGESGTVAHQEWSDFLATNRSAVSAYDVDYADGAVIYWLTGDTTAGQAAIQHAEQYMVNNPNGRAAGPLTFDENYYIYRDLLLTYDLAYDLLSPSQRTTWLRYIALQGSICQSAGPGSSTGNIHLLWMFCAYGSAVLLDGENVSIQVTDEPVVRGNTVNSGDALHYPIDASTFRVNDTPGQVGSQYSENTDFTYNRVTNVCVQCINWSPTGAGTNEPAAGATYYVSYTFTPDVARWKSDTRTALEYHLSYQWRDGFYSGGPNPYGNLVADFLPYFIEMFKRDTGVDYGQSPDVKRIVDMYFYLHMPFSQYYQTRPTLPLNDTTWPYSAAGDSWWWPVGYNTSRQDHWHSFLRNFVGWATSEYTGDPAGYDQQYAWFWTQAYRHANGSIAYDYDNGGTNYSTSPDWREAVWSNNALLKPYLNTTAVPPASWPSHRYFRGKEVVIDRTDDANAPDPTSTLVSMVAGNHSYFNEHDQGDSGSFTFTSQGVDWAIAPGYGFAHLNEHSTVGIAGLSGGDFPALIPGYPFGGFSHFTSTALTDQASVMSADLHNAWSTTVGSSPVERANRYLLSIHDGQTPTYLVVGDDMQRTGGTSDTYTWYMQTSRFNSLTTDQAHHQAIVADRNNGTNLMVTTAWPTTTSLSWSMSGDGGGTHQRLDDTVTATNPYFLHLLVPGGATGGTTTSTAVAGGVMATVSWPGGLNDTVLWKTGSTTISGNGLTSDAQMTLLRTTNGAVTGLAVMSGRAVSYNGRALLAVGDGTEPVTVSAFGPTAGIQTTDASQIRLGLPYVTAATVEDGGVSIPVYNDGAVAYINGGLPLSEIRRGNGQRYHQDFNTGDLTSIYRYNISHDGSDTFTANGGALELRATPYDWPSLSKHDSTIYRRTGIFPTILPPLDHADATYSFRFKFTDTNANPRQFSTYFRTIDRNPLDWNMNQDYVRLDFDGVNNQVRLGQRVNGPWSDINSNSVLTTTIPAVAATLNDSAWHTVSLKLLGTGATVVVDGQTLINNQVLPAGTSSGYLQWQVTGTSPVFLDDLDVEAIDQTPPVAPTGARFDYHPDGTGTVTAVYGHGQSTDMDGLRFYGSSTPVAPTTDPSTLTLISSSSSPASALAFSGVDPNGFYALQVKDPSGNVSVLAPVTIDLSAPGAVMDLRAQ